MRYSHEWGCTGAGRPENSIRGKESGLVPYIPAVTCQAVSCLPHLKTWRAPSPFCPQPLTEAKTHPGLLGPPASGPSFSWPRLSCILLSSLQALVQLWTPRKKGVGNLPNSRSEGASSNLGVEVNSTGPLSSIRTGILSWTLLISVATNSTRRSKCSVKIWDRIPLLCGALFLFVSWRDRLSSALPPRCWIPALQPNRQKMKPKPALPSQLMSHSLPQTSKYGLLMAGGWCRNLTTATGTLHYVAWLILRGSQKLPQTGEKQGAVLPPKHQQALRAFPRGGSGIGKYASLKPLVWFPLFH